MERLYSYGQNHTNFYELAKRLKARSEWYMGQMIGKPVANGYGYYTGHMPQYLKDKFFAQAHVIDYIVWSYDTPIAWHTNTGWELPEYTYSATTTKHQGKINVALSVITKV
jgi:hypothetical protein